MNFSTLFTILVTLGSETPEFTLLTITPFVAIIQIFVWQLLKGCCYGNQLNLGDVRRHRQEWPILIALAFNNGLADHEAAFRGLNRLHCVEIGELLSNNLGVYAVKTCNFCRDLAAIWQRSSVNTLAFQNGSEGCNFDYRAVMAIISVQHVEIWWDSFQWPRSLRHKKLYSRRLNFFCGDFQYVQ